MCLARALLVLAGHCRPEALAANVAGDLCPVDSSVADRGRGVRAVNAAGPELGSDADRPLAPRGAAPDERFGEPRACERALGFEVVERRGNRLLGEAARGELAL